MATSAAEFKVPPGPLVDNEMPPRRTTDGYEDYQGDLRDVHQVLSSLLTQQAKQNGGIKWKDWLPVGITCAVLLVGTVRWTSTTESDLRQQVIIAEAEAKAARAEASNLRAIIDKMETYNQNTREQFAANGWLIDPQSGRITKVRPSDAIRPR